MQIYLVGYALYDRDWKKASGARYMTKHSSTSREHQKYNERNIKHRRNALI